MYIIYNVEMNMRFRIKEILREKGKTKYWLYIRLGLSYQNFNRLINNETTSIKFENLKSLCEILECTPNDLFEDYPNKKYKQARACFLILGLRCRINHVERQGEGLFSESALTPLTTPLPENSSKPPFPLNL